MTVRFIQSSSSTFAHFRACFSTFHKTSPSILGTGFTVFIPTHLQNRVTNRYPISQKHIQKRSNPTHFITFFRGYSRPFSGRFFIRFSSQMSFFGLDYNDFVTKTIEFKQKHTCYFSAFFPCEPHR